MKKPGNNKSGNTNKDKSFGDFACDLLKNPDSLSRTLDSVDNVVSTLGETVKSVTDAFKEVEKTKQTQADCDVLIISAQEQTKQIVVNGTISIAEIHKNDRQDQRRHEEAMAELRMEEIRQNSLLQQQEKVLDKMLEHTTSPDQLHVAYKSLLLKNDKM